MKTLDLFFAAVRVPLDGAMILAAAAVAYWVRVHPAVAAVLPVRFDIDPYELLRVVGFVAVGWVGIFALNRLYTVRRMAIREEVTRVVYAVSTGMMAVFAVIFFSREIFDSRFIVLAAWGLAMAFIIMARLALRVVQRWLFAHGYGRHVVVLIGSKEDIAPLKEEFHRRPGLGFVCAGSRPVFDGECESWIRRLKNTKGVDAIMLADANVGRRDALKVMTFCEQEHVDFLYTADLLGAATGRLEPHTFAGIPMFEVQRTPLDGWGRIYKRTFDVVASALLIVGTLPIQIPVALVLLAERQGGVLFRRLPNGKPATRIGQGGRPFTFLKFRSMVKNAHALRFDKAFLQQYGNERNGGPLFKLEHDPRVTPFGRWIRRTSIDEFPQLYLVFAGKMSLVGPRPHLPEEVAAYKPEYKKVLSIKPGVTGMAQVSGRADLEFADEVRLDTYYIEHWSPWLDLTILLKTPFAVFSKKGAK